MRWLGLAILLLLSGCYPYGYPYYGYPNSGYGYGYSGYPSYQTYSPGYYSSAPAPYGGGQQYGGGQRYGGGQQSYPQGAQTGYGQPAGTDPHNCGTPDEPKPCYH